MKFKSSPHKYRDLHVLKFGMIIKCHVKIPLWKTKCKEISEFGLQNLEVLNFLLQFKGDEAEI